MRKSVIAWGLIVGGIAFGVSGVVTAISAAEHPEHPAKHKEICSGCKMEVKEGELLCPDCGGVLKEKDGKDWCESKSCEKDGKPADKTGKGVCKHCCKHKEPAPKK